MRSLRAFTTRHSTIAPAQPEQIQATASELIRVIDAVLEEGRFYTIRCARSIDPP